MESCLDNIFVLNKNFEAIGVIDFASSIIWTTRYYEAGDFEIYAQATDKAINLLQEDFYLIREDCDMIGIIENISITTDAENGDWLTVTGRDAKSILERRIVWNQTNLYGNVANGIITLLNNNIISADSNRKISNFTATTPSTSVFTDTFEKQITGTNLYEAILAICQEFYYGSKVTLNNGIFNFELYKGIDRSVNQTTNPHIVFSPEYDNFLASNYSLELGSYKNVALVAGEGEGTARKTQTVGTATGLNRYEIYVDSRNTSSNEGEITEAEYNKLLIAEGQETLAENIRTETFEGTINSGRTYIYNEDYFLGDIVTVKNEFNMQKDVRIIEVIESLDENGLTITPSFEDRM